MSSVRNSIYEQDADFKKTSGSGRTDEFAGLTRIPARPVAFFRLESADGVFQTTLNPRILCYDPQTLLRLPSPPHAV